MAIFGSQNSKPKRLQRPPDPVLAQIAALPLQRPPAQPLPAQTHTVPCRPPTQKLISYTSAPPIIHPGRSTSRPHAQRPQGAQPPQQYRPPQLPRPTVAPCTTLSPVATPPATCAATAPAPQPGAWLAQGSQRRNVDSQLCRLISSKFESVLTLIDSDQFNGEEHELGQ